MTKSDKALNSATLELTQKLQMHFPRDIAPDVLKEWNGYSTDLLTECLAGVFGKMPTEQAPAVEPIIDCAADPFVPNGWTVETHQPGGQWKWNPEQVEFYLSLEQNKGKVITGNKLRQELAGKPVLNANVLDYLLKNPQLIPEEWKKDSNGNTRYIFFWGTIYRYAVGILCVRYLCFYDGRWHWSYRWLDNVWDSRSPAALLAS